MHDRGTTTNNRYATFPDTPSARRNLSALLRESTRLRYATIATATGHDKSWVSRFLSGQGLISMTELLLWLDACELELAPQGAPPGSAPPDAVALDRLSEAIKTLQAAYPKHQMECCDQCECVVAALQVALLTLKTVQQPRSTS